MFRYFFLLLSVIFATSNELSSSSTLSEWFEELSKDSRRLDNIHCHEQVDCVEVDFEFESLSKEAYTELFGLTFKQPAELEYAVWSDEYIRKFEFHADGRGHIRETEKGDFSVILKDSSDTVRINICKDASQCKFAAYRIDRVAEMQDMGEDSEEEEIREKLVLSDHSFTDKELERRLQKHGKGRRKLQSDFDYISITFLYDPNTITESDAEQWVSDALYNFNYALSAFPETQIRLMYNTLQSVSSGTFGVASTTARTGAEAIATNQLCQTAANNLAAEHHADLYHCFVPQWCDGCDGFANRRWAMSAVHRRSVVAPDYTVAEHEIGHQFGMSHTNPDESIMCAGDCKTDSFLQSSIDRMKSYWQVNRHGDNFEYTYVRVTWNKDTCEDNGMERITTADECKLAAGQLGFPIEHGFTSSFWRSSVHGGCIYEVDKQDIDFNTNVNNSNNHDDRHAVCKQSRRRRRKL